MIVVNRNLRRRATRTTGPRGGITRTRSRAVTGPRGGISRVTNTRGGNSRNRGTRTVYIGAA